MNRLIPLALILALPSPAYAVEPVPPYWAAKPLPPVVEIVRAPWIVAEICAYTFNYQGSGHYEGCAIRPAPWDVYKLQRMADALKRNGDDAAAEQIEEAHVKAGACIILMPDPSDASIGQHFYEELKAHELGHCTGWTHPNRG